jgi:hypothetical protein
MMARKDGFDMRTITTRTRANGRARRAARGLTRLFPSDSGQGVAEFALALPIILIILLGMVEFSNAYDQVHGLAGLSREGANIAARGTGLSEVLTTVVANGETLDLSTDGGAIVSRLVVKQGQPVIMAQIATDGYDKQSRLTDQDVAAEWIASAGFAEGSTHYTVEVFLNYEPLTPLSRLYGAMAPSQLYERAVF